MVGVVAVQGGQVERGGEAGLAVGEEVLEALVRLRGGAEARELAHRPHLAAVPRGVDAASVRVLPRQAEVALGIKAGDVSGVASGSTGAPETVVQSFFHGGVPARAFSYAFFQRSRPPRSPGEPSDRDPSRGPSSYLRGEDSRSPGDSQADPKAA